MAKPLEVGDTLRNPELALMLRRVAREGSVALHQGATARRIVAAVANRGGGITLGDLRDYRPLRREAVCGSFRRWRVCGMPPPSSGGIGVLQLLGILERSGLPPGPVERADAVHHFAEAGRLVYADRSRYVGDPDFVRVPAAGVAGERLPRAAQPPDRTGQGHGHCRAWKRSFHTSAGRW
jgi:gamma-glutamyltranspeptidase/glutathione hydrolase